MQDLYHQPDPTPKQPPQEIAGLYAVDPMQLPQSIWVHPPLRVEAWASKWGTEGFCGLEVRLKVEVDGART